MKNKDNENKLLTEKVYSPIEDKTVAKSNPSKSSIWKNCYKEEELTDVLGGYMKMYCYTFKFDGLKPVQLVKFEKIK